MDHHLEMMGIIMYLLHLMYHFLSLLLIVKITPLILNYNAYHKQLLSFFDKSDEDIDVGGIEEASKKMLHERAFSYLKKIDLKDDYHLEILRDQSSSQLKEAINKTIKYNEENEEYERCAFFKKFLDFLNSSSYLNNKNK